VFAIIPSTSKLPQKIGGIMSAAIFTKSLSGKVAVVTGATSGIGKYAAIALSQAGARVVLAGRREKEGDAVVADIRKLDGEAMFIKTDVTEEGDVEALISQTVSKYGRLDIAVNNAGLESSGSVAEISEQEYRKIFDCNVWGVIAAMKYEVPAMLKTGGGSIINISSVAGHIGMAGAGVYVASKHAVEGFTKCAALELAQQGIRVNTVAPGAITTEMFNRFTEGTEGVAEYITSLHPMGRIGSPDEIANPIVFLASSAASFMTGQHLTIDGGWTAQ
jgi:NAD(P)-dependent dehydrogenase (short-subunit alcohol dehydrogenase family)